MPIAKPLLTGLAVLAVFFAGYYAARLKSEVAEEPTAQTERASDGSHEQFEDATKRWSTKSGMPMERILAGYGRRSMFIPTTNQGSGMTCIQLQITDGSLGGEPVYCYKDETIELLAEYSDVE